jgi:hypothetical protein
MSIPYNNVLFFAQNGVTYANSGTGAVTGDFGCLVVMEDGTTFSNIDQRDADNITIAEGVTYNQGYQIVGKTTGFTVSAGSVAAIKLD